MKNDEKWDETLNHLSVFGWAMLFSCLVIDLCCIVYLWLWRGDIRVCHACVLNGLKTHQSVSDSRWSIIFSWPVQELCRRWEQYVLDHQAYLQSFDDCRAWLTDMQSRVSDVLDTSGDKTTIQDRLSIVQVTTGFLTQRAGHWFWYLLLDTVGCRSAAQVRLAGSDERQQAW